MTGEPLNGQTEPPTAEQWRPAIPLVPVVYPTSNPPGIGAGASPGEADSVLLITETLNGHRRHPGSGERQVDLDTDT
jgi:hypothetical protein